MSIYNLPLKAENRENIDSFVCLTPYVYEYLTLAAKERDELTEKVKSLHELIELQNKKLVKYEAYIELFSLLPNNETDTNATIIKD